MREACISNRTSDGKTLWHAMQGQSMQSSPIGYELDGRQYAITRAGEPRPTLCRMELLVAAARQANSACLAWQ
ncbi:MAG: hypothetical protein ABI759_12480 [Candidatus Solibacter sp.]